jgi:plastocyanin
MNMVRFVSILFITVMCFTVLFSGCIGDKNKTEPVNTTRVITETATDTPSNIPLPEVITTGNVIQVKIDGARGFIPNIRTIKVGDEVVWDNFDTIAVTLVSHDGLFDAKVLAYYKQYRYVFLEPGTFDFSLENKNLTGTIIVESRAILAPSSTTSGELPPNALYVTVRIKKMNDWSTGNEIKYELDTLKVKVMNQINSPLTIKAQIRSGDRILEERTFTLEKQDSSVEFSNERNHFINDTNVDLRLLVKGYAPIDYKFIEVDQLN